MEYYRLTDPDFVAQLEQAYKSLTSKLIIYETLVHMGFSKQRIAQTLCVSEDSLRTYKSRTKDNKQ